MCPAKSLFWSDKTKMWSDMQKNKIEKNVNTKYFIYTKYIVLWFEHSGMSEMLPHAWDTRGGF